MDEVANFRTNLRWLGDELGLSQRDFAEKLGLAYPGLNRILKGKQNPELETCRRIAEKCAALIGQPKMSAKLVWMLREPAVFQKSVEKMACLA